MNHHAMNLNGFSLGDELGLAESLGNVEGNKRRSLSPFDQLMVNKVGVLPASKQAGVLPEKRSANQPLTLAYKQTSTTRAPIFYKKSKPVAMTEAKSLPLGVPAFKPLKSVTSLPAVGSNIQQIAKKNADTAFSRKAAVYQFVAPNLSVANMSFIQAQMAQQAMENKRQDSMVTSPQVNSFTVPAFQALPSSVSRISTGQIVSAKIVANKAATNGYSPIQRIDNFNGNGDQNEAYSQKVPVTTRPLPQVDLKGHTVGELAVVANVSVAAIKRAIEMRQKQLLAEQENQLRKQMVEMEQRREEQIAQQLALYQQEHQKFLATSTIEPSTTISTTSTTVRTTTPRQRVPATHKPLGGGNKVMNAPKEYYPVGYEKNFDDNFVTKVDLPPTTFHCGDQKHFPGLYGDIDLGCMVFHVCALTDDGLIMKSFLCPESTLFDQSILKCNWWFYVDCKSSKTLYDANLPVSKSYQLMKALTFFSNYKKKSANDNDSGVDIEALKNSVLSKRNTDNA